MLSSIKSWLQGIAADQGPRIKSAWQAGCDAYKEDSKPVTPTPAQGKSVSPAAAFMGAHETAAMPTCPECENDLGSETDEVEEGDVVYCDECGTEYQVVSLEPLELSRIDDQGEPLELSDVGTNDDLDYDLQHELEKDKR